MIRDALQAEVKELKEKSDDAAKERAYVEKIRSDTKEFYQQAFSSQTQILGITGVILTALASTYGRAAGRVFGQAPRGVTITVLASTGHPRRNRK